jgi:uncharacterized protein
MSTLPGTLHRGLVHAGIALDRGREPHRHLRQALSSVPQEPCGIEVMSAEARARTMFVRLSVGGAVFLVAWIVVLGRH